MTLVAKSRTSAGILLHRRTARGLEVLLVHPSGPFFTLKNHGAWSFPMGKTTPGEELLDAALREFGEETGFSADAPAVPLGSVRQRSGKVVLAWAVRGDADPLALRSDTFKMEWPRRSGVNSTFPEVDQAAWFDLPEARRRILRAQATFLDELVATLSEEA